MPPGCESASIKEVNVEQFPRGGAINNRNFVKSKDGTVYHGPFAGCPTLPGWDMTTGFGSPNAPKFLEIITRARAEDNAEAG